MSATIADPDRLRQLARDLRRFEDQIKSETRTLRSTFARASWTDSEGRRFEDSLKQMISNVEKAASIAQGLSNTANRKASALDQYLRNH